MSRLENALADVLALGWQPWLTHEAAHRRWACEAVIAPLAPQGTRVYGELQATPLAAVESLLAALRVSPAWILWDDFLSALEANLNARKA
jgi:hypothetical protein